MPGFDPSVPPDRTAAAYAFVESRMLVHLAPELRVSTLEEVEACATITAGPFPIGRPGEPPAVAVALSAAAECPGSELKGLRELFGLLSETEMEVAARAFQILEWSTAHAFCGRCGGATVFSTYEAARTCTSCGAMYFPRITPAVITLVRRGPEILLARGLRFGPRFYSLIAGFVEPGETLEQAVQREVCEEVGIQVRDITYMASQSWPFPSQLMVGFTANHAAGELRINEAELSDARWVRVDNLPADIELPSTYSISGRLIRSALGR
jgi:NAD+ diphosphatase